MGENDKNSPYQISLCSVFETIITPGSNPYLKKLGEESEDGLVIGDVLNFQMLLDTNDTGISRTLLQFGIKEEVSTKSFRTELQQLKGEIDGEITMLDIGANIGYYTLLEADVLGERAKIFSIEPSPRNIDILKRNVELNDFTAQVAVHQQAIGDRDGEAELYLADRSNWHSIHQIEGHNESINIEMVTVNKFLSDQGLSPDSINVVRMDVEGFEVEIFQEMDQMLASETPLLVFIETHPYLRDPEEMNQVIDSIEENNFEIRSCALDIYGGRFDHGWYEKEAHFESFKEIKQHHRNSDAAVELIVKKHQ